MFGIARVGKHMWEEPVISGTRGSGTVFFRGCALRCVYCQNHAISRGGGAGLNVSGEQLISLMLYLQDEGAHNINLVTPSHYAVKLAVVLSKAKNKLKIPIVYNSGGYDKPNDLRALDGLIDVYLPDLKYADERATARYCAKPDYFTVAKDAIREMRRLQPKDVFDKGLMTRGVIVRHLILPDNLQNSFKALDFLAHLDKTLYVSLMSQYFPAAAVTDSNFPELNRRITRAEYNAVRRYFLQTGLKNGFAQDLSSATEDYVPDFNLDELRAALKKAKSFYRDNNRFSKRILHDNR